MSKARQNRLREARKWFLEQGFTEDSHVVKAYRKKFNVDKDCAMRELCMLHVLSPEKQKSYENQLAVKKRKRQEGRMTKEYINPDQDEFFYFIAGYTSGGVPYGITWEQARKDGLIEEDDEDYDEELPYQ